MAECADRPAPADESAPRLLPWDSAVQAILRCAAARARTGRIVIGIGGPVASGKTMLAERLSDCVISTDAYLPDYDRVPHHERDEPHHADLARLEQDLLALRAGRETRVPVWSFKTHRREGFRLVGPAPVIVCEGIHALHERVASALDVAVYVEAPKEVRLARWRAREASGARGWSVEFASSFFHEVAEPTFNRYAPSYRLRADIIVKNDEG